MPPEAAFMAVSVRCGAVNARPSVLCDEKVPAGRPFHYNLLLL